MVGRVVIMAILALGVGVAVVLAMRPAWFERELLPLEHAAYINTHSANYEVPADLIAAVIHQESRWNERAESSAGAVGLMQLTPETARGIAQRTGGSAFVEEDLLDPEISIRYGTWYLRHMLNQFPNEDRDRTVVALAAYNAGQGTVRAWLEGDIAWDGRTVSDIPFDETRTYVRRIGELRQRYRRTWGEQLDLDVAPDWIDEYPTP